MEEKKYKLITGVVSALLLLIILLQNTEIVTFRILFWEFTMSRIILLPLVLLAGLIIGFFLGRKSRDL